VRDIRRRLVTLATAVGIMVTAGIALGHETTTDARLSRIGPAPDFALVAQDGRVLALRDLRGKVVAVTFIYASCADTCPLLTAKLATLQSALGADFGSRVRFVSITVDPERDTSAVLAHYAHAHGANLAGWAFVTGSADQIRKVARGYGVYAKRNPAGDVDHTLLTSVIDQRGILRVQYLGVRFDPQELLSDIRSLLMEADPQ
jgi:protein SCO1/2